MFDKIKNKKKKTKAKKKLSWIMKVMGKVTDNHGKILSVLTIIMILAIAVAWYKPLLAVYHDYQTLKDQEHKATALRGELQENIQMSSENYYLLGAGEAYREALPQGLDSRDLFLDLKQIAESYGFHVYKFNVELPEEEIIGEKKYYFAFFNLQPEEENDLIGFIRELEDHERFMEIMALNNLSDINEYAFQIKVYYRD